MTTNLRKDIARGAAWMTALKLSERTIGMISTLILARILVPEDFGLVAMAMSIVATTEVFTAFGFDVVLIQNQKAERPHYDTAWSLQVIFGALGAVCLVLLAEPTTWFYKEPRLEAVMYVIALGFFIRSLENIAVVEFRKQLQFEKEAKYRLIIKLIGFSITIPLALIMKSYWALVIGQLSLNIATFGLSYVFKRYRPHLSFEKMGEIFRFSRWLFLNNSISFIRFNISHFVIGRLSGARSLGLFGMAYQISTLVSTELVAPINRAVFPGYSKMVDDRGKLVNTYLDVMGGIMMIALPSALGIAVTADVVVPFLLGENWIDTIPLFKILAIYGAIHSLTSNSVFIFYALAKPQILTRIAILEVSFIVPLMYLMTHHWGSEGAALALLITVIFVDLPLVWRAVADELHISINRFLKVLWRPLVASATMFGLLQTMSHYLQTSHLLEGVPLIILLIGCGVVVYCCTLLLLWRFSGSPSGPESTVTDLLTRKFGVNLAKGK